MDGTVGLGAMMAGGARVRQRPRQERDFYGTPPEVTRALLRRHSVAHHVVWEPCCGDGAIVNVLKEQGVQKVHCSDIHPLMDGATTADFLTNFEMPEGCTAIITNPPYKLAAEFIAHALSFERAFLAILLKSTFWHAKKRQGLFSKHPPSYIHPLTWRPDFLNLGGPTMEAIWTVWDGRGGLPVYEPLHRD